MHRRLVLDVDGPQRMLQLIVYNLLLLLVDARFGGFGAGCATAQQITSTYTTDIVRPANDFSRLVVEVGMLSVHVFGTNKASALTANHKFILELLALGLRRELSADTGSLYIEQ